MKRTIFTSVSVIAIFAASSAMAQSNTSTVDQDATNSQAYVTQNGSSSSSTIEQDGADNWANVEQGNVIAAASGNSAIVRQTGTDTASIPAPDVPPANYEEGVSNYATVKQDGNGGSVTVDQVGNNRADVTQQYTPGTGQTATVDQTSDPLDGTQNYSSTNQRGTDIDAATIQTGRGNNAQISQGFAAFSNATINQDGDFNSAQIDQNGALGSETEGASSTINQTGDANYADSFQDGIGAESTISQFGDTNKAEAMQDGDNSSGIFQTGNTNEATVVQGGGAGNSSTVNQTGNGNAVGDVGGPGLAPTVVGVRQMGSNNLSTVDQTTSGASALVDQSGGEHRSDINQNSAARASVCSSRRWPTLLSRSWGPWRTTCAA